MPREPEVTLQIWDRELGGWTCFDSQPRSLSVTPNPESKENAALINGVKSPKQLQNKGRTGCYGHRVDTPSTPRGAAIPALRATRAMAAPSGISEGVTVV